MIDILKRMNEELEEEEVGEIMENIDEVDSDDDIEVDLHERVKHISLDNADDVWNALTEDERNDFEALLNKGIHLYSCIQQYNDVVRCDR